MNKTVVTGSSGFIGSHLMKRINAAGLKHSDMKYIRSLDADIVFFLSTYGNMSHHTKYGEMLAANVIDLTAILSMFRGWLCYMSSSSVTLPVQTPYSRFKRAGEEIVLGFPEIEPCVVRPFSVVGVHEQKEHLIPTLIRSCMEGDPMDFDASPVHDFIDVTDVCDALVSLAKDKATGIFELGSGIPHSNQQVRDLVERACGKKANIQGSLRMRAYDNEHWYCRTPTPYLYHTKTLEQSISEMVEAYKHEKEKTDSTKSQNH